MSDQITKFGFTFGALQVMRACCDGRYHTLIIQTPFEAVHISASPTGRKLHIGRMKRSEHAKAEKP